MKTKTTCLAIAEEIGNDSWELQNFMQLHVRAKSEEIIDALRKDQKWQLNHMDCISSRIDSLIQDIESS